MIAWLLAGLLAPWFAAYRLVRRFDAGAGGAWIAWFHIALAFGLALGLASCAYFLALLSFGSPGRGYCSLEVLGFTVLGLIAWRAPARAPIAVAAAPQRRWAPCDFYQTLPRMAFVAATITGLLGMARLLAQEPHGGWDAWDIWTMRARYLYRSGDQWRNAFASAFPNSDYPLLVSGSSARLWTYLAYDPMWGPYLVAVGFTLAAVGLLTAGVGRLRGPTCGWLAGLSLLGTVRYLNHGASLYADVPLSFFFLAALLLLALSDAGERPSGGLRVLAGLSAALAAWTKNEGLMFLVIVLVVRAVMGWRRNGRLAMFQEVGLCLAGAAPVLVVLVLFKVLLAPPSALLAGQSWQAMLPKLVDASRIGFILGGIGWAAWHDGKALLVVLPLAFLVLGAAAARPRRALSGILGALGLMLAGYFLIYLTSSSDLAWHVYNSVNRLLLQLWPSILLAVFLYLDDPLTAILRSRRLLPPLAEYGRQPDCS